MGIRPLAGRRLLSPVLSCRRAHGDGTVGTSGISGAAGVPPGVGGLGGGGGAPLPLPPSHSRSGGAEPHSPGPRGRDSRRSKPRVLRGPPSLPLLLPPSPTKVASARLPPISPGPHRGAPGHCPAALLAPSTVQLPEGELEGKFENWDLNRLTWRWLNKCPNEFSVFLCSFDSCSKTSEKCLSE